MKINVTGKGLHVLYEHAYDGNRLVHWAELALEWIDVAEAHIFKLEKELKELKEEAKDE